MFEWVGLRLSNNNSFMGKYGIRTGRNVTINIQRRSYDGVNVGARLKRIGHFNKKQRKV